MRMAWSYSFLLIALWVISPLSHAGNTPKWDAQANAASCKLKLGSAGIKVSPETLMKDIEYTSRVTVKLPYYMTKAYTAQFLPLEFTKRDPVNFETYLAYSKGSEIIPTFALVESWHNIVKILDGYYVSLHFKSEAERKTFVEKIRYFAQVYEGELTSNGKTQYPLALTLNQYETLQTAFPDLFGVKLNDESPHNDPMDIRVEASSYVELQHLSDQIIYSDRNNGIYYFSGRKVVGFRNNKGEYFKITIYRDGRLDDANFASHSEILRRQREAQKLINDTSSMKNPQTEILAGRRLLDQSIAQLKVAVENAWTGPVRVDVEGQTEKLQKLLEINDSDRGDTQKAIIELAYHRYVDVISRVRDRKSTELNLALPDIRKIERGLKSFLKGDPKTQRRLKLYGLNSENLADNIYLVHGELIHDNMARLLLGQFVDNTTVQAGTFGAHIELSYDANGNLSSVKIISDVMQLLKSPKKMSQAQRRALEKLFEDTVQQNNQ